MCGWIQVQIEDMLENAAESSALECHKKDRQRHSRMARNQPSQPRTGK
uniref:Uncharacterized protein n=1 Tax=Anguilla anguilla TaxID=7936 RepID=A0A0E9RPG7_ANGAN